MSFIKAEWRKLAMMTYEIDASLLEEYIPKGTILDLYQNKCFISLVGFMFLNTKVLGFKIPYHINFEEVNLRFYVKPQNSDASKRGVVFIKEIVPLPIAALIANTVYSENYVATKMKHVWNDTQDSKDIEYSWKNKRSWQSIRVNSGNKIVPIIARTEAEFLVEHYWGYAKVTDSKTNIYEVTHPRWNQYNINDFSINVDFGECYGSKFDFLSRQAPHSVILAEGSEVTVESKRVIK